MARLDSKLDHSLLVVVHWSVGGLSDAQMLSSAALSGVCCVTSLGLVHRILVLIVREGGVPLLSLPLRPIVVEPTLRGIFIGVVCRSLKSHTRPQNDRITSLIADRGRDESV